MSQAVAARAGRRLSIEMATLQVQTLKEFPPVDEDIRHRKIARLLRLRRQAHSQAMKLFRTQRREWEEGLETEIGRAEARVAAIKGGITREERATLRQYLVARCPRPPVFTPLPPFEDMVALVTDAMEEQRERNAEEERKAAREREEEVRRYAAATLRSPRVRTPGAGPASTRGSGGGSGGAVGGGSGGGGGAAAAGAGSAKEMSLLEAMRSIQTRPTSPRGSQGGGLATQRSILGRKFDFGDASPRTPRGGGAHPTASLRREVSFRTASILQPGGTGGGSGGGGGGGGDA